MEVDVESTERIFLWGAIAVLFVLCLVNFVKRGESEFDLKRASAKAAYYRQYAEQCSESNEQMDAALDRCIDYIKLLAGSGSSFSQ